jgi:hypothetical protein
MLQSQGEGEKSQPFKTYSIAQTAVSFLENRPIANFSLLNPFYSLSTFLPLVI